MSKADTFRDQTVLELEALLAEKRAELFGLRNKVQREKKVDHPHKALHLRKEIARILTIIREKQLAEAGAN